MRILISCDMEGISGVVNWEQVNPEKKEYEHGRDLMVGDVNAAIEGAYHGGATFVAVSDAHHDGRNILLRDLDRRAVLNSGDFPRFAMMQDINSSNKYDGVIFVGYHARAGTRDAVLCHTWWGEIADVWLNDVVVGEIGLNAALAGCFDVPVIAICGDEAACLEAQTLLGNEVRTAVVKKGTGYFSAQCLALEESRARISEAVSAAVQGLKHGTKYTRFSVGKPIDVRVAFKHPNQAERACVFPQVRRVDGLQVSIVAEDMFTANAFFRTISALSSAE